MGLFLQIVGGLVIAAVVLVVVGFYWLKWKLTKAVGSLGEVMAELAQNGPIPARVQLEHADDLEWKNRDELDALASALRELGYRDCGSFRHSILPVLGLAHEELSVYALVAEHPESGLFVDLATGYADGRWLTVSTSPENGLDRPDGMPIERFVDTPVENLHGILLDRRGDGPYRPTPASGFVDAVLKYSDEELLWRTARGGPMSEEIRRVAALASQTVTDAQVRETREQMRSNQLWEADEALRARFLDSADLGAREWDEMRDDVNFVHDALSVDEVVERIEDELDYEDEDACERFLQEARDVFASSTPRSAFAEIAARIPGARTLERVGDVDGPLPADVYRAISRSDVLTV